MSLHLVTGHAGYEHITPADHGAFHNALLLSGSYVLNIGNKFSASVISNNSIQISDGELYMQGRYIRMKSGEYEDVTIENGTQDSVRNDLIVARYIKDETTGIESVSFVVIKGTPAVSNPSDPEYIEGDILNGALVADYPMYRVPLVGLNVGELVPLFDTIDSFDARIEEIDKNFFPKSGGMLSSAGYLNQLNINRKGDMGGDVGIGFYMHDTQIGTFAYDVAKSDFVVRFGTDSSSDKSKKLIHTGNMKDYVLPLVNGGKPIVKTYSNDVIIFDNINDNPSVTWIDFRANGEDIGAFGFTKSGTPVLWVNDSSQKILHAGNKPSGSYTGNGTLRTITTGGVGSVVLIRQKGTTNHVIVDESGYFGVVNGSFVCGSGISTDASCNISLASDSVFNTSGSNYLYQVL